MFDIGAHSTHSSRAIYGSRQGLRLSAETYEMTKHLLTPFLPKPRQNSGPILHTYDPFMQTCITSTMHCVQNC
jgi:hypothetical protein